MLRRAALLGHETAGHLSEIDVSTPAVVLKLVPNLMAYGSLGVIRSLGRLGVPVYGVHDGRLAPAANSRFLHGRYFWDAPTDNPEQLTAGLLRLADQIGAPAVLYATDDAGAIFLAEHGEGLRSNFLFPRPAADLPRRVADKFELYQLCDQLGIPAPRAVLTDSEPEARRFADSTGFPLVAKLTTPLFRPNGVLSTTIITEQVELARIVGACADAGGSVLLQEFIPVGQECDWLFHGYCDGNSVCRPAFTGVKDRSYPARAGMTTVGRSVANDRLRDQVTTLLAAIGYRGLVALDLRRDSRDGQYKLLDFNPRLGAGFRLFQDTAGTDVVRAQYLDLTGQTAPDGAQVSGRKFVVESYDALAAVSYWRNGELTARSWAASLRGTNETAWFARDDLLPFGVMCAYMTAWAASRPVRFRHHAAPAAGDRSNIGRYSVGRGARRTSSKTSHAAASRVRA